MTSGSETLSISFELSERDMAFFRERLAQAREAHVDFEETQVIEAAEALVAEAKKRGVPAFVMDSLSKLEPLTSMLKDEEWRLEGEDRARVLDALAYFVEPVDLIPDRIPGIGFLDDAIMIELVAQELVNEIESFADFRDFVTSRAKADAALIEEQRVELQDRMRRRARRARGGGGGGGGRSPLSLF